MPNIREQLKRGRLEKLGEIFAKAKEEGKVIDKKRLTSMMIVEHSISKKTALEEIEAVMEYGN